MKTKTTLIIFLAVILISSVSCFHKSVMTGEADDIEKVIIYSQDNKNYLIALETIFQATSKESGGGMTTISGYTDLRISVYDLETGTLIAREKAGRLAEDRNTNMLGCINGNLWLYSADEDLVLHSLNPLTLEINITQEDFFEKNPALKDKLAKPEWYNATTFFAFNEIENKLVITDNEGFRYFLNPETLIAEKLDEEVAMSNFFMNRYFSTSVDLGEKYLGFSGDLRKTITCDNKELNPSLTFIDGQFLVDCNVKRIGSVFTAKINEIQKQNDGVTKTLDSLKLVYGNDTWRYSDYYEIESKKRNSEYELDEFNRNLKYLQEGTYSGSILLMGNNEDFFVVHKSSTNNDAFLTISKIDYENDLVTEAWRTVLDNIFFDPTSAESTDAFSTVFSKGNPTFDFMFFDLIESKLLVVYMLHAICIDTETGSVIWKTRI